MSTKISIFDFETSTNKTNYFKKTGDSVVYLGFGKTLDGLKSYKFTTIEEFIKILLKNYNDFELIYFHNLSFDGYFILKYLINVKRVPLLNDEPNNQIGLFVLRNGSKIYEIVWKTRIFNKYKTFKFKCSLRLLSASVNQLGESVELSKYDGEPDGDFYDNEPFLKWDAYPKLFTDYLMRDVEIVRLSLLKFDEAIKKLPTYKMYQEKINWHTTLTIGSLAYKIQLGYAFDYFKKIKKNFEGLFINEETYKIADKINKGGWTQFNPEIQNKLIGPFNGVGFDYNSHYPAMMTNLLPYGELVKVPNDYVAKNKELIYINVKIGLAKQKHSSIVNLFNWNKNNDISTDFEPNYRYTTIQTNFNAWYLLEEFEIMKKFYHFEKVEIIAKYKAKAEYWAKDFIETLYKLRYDFKKLNDKALSTSIKILLNSAYGKHATRADFNNEIFILKTDANKYFNKETQKYEGVITVEKTYNNTKYTKDYEILHENKDFKLDKYITLICKPKNNNKKLFYNKLAAATITAYARIKIFQDILNIGVDKFIYADTDSIYCFNPNTDKLNLDNEKLGYLKEENKFSYFFARGAKVYALFDKNQNIISGKYSGISQKFLKNNISLELYKSNEAVLLRANTRPVYLKSGIIIEEVDYEPKSRTI